MIRRLLATLMGWVRTRPAAVEGSEVCNPYGDPAHGTYSASWRRTPLCGCCTYTAHDVDRV